MTFEQTSKIPYREEGKYINFVFPLNAFSFRSLLEGKDSNNNRFLVYHIYGEKLSMFIERKIHLTLYDLWEDYLDYVIMFGEEPGVFGEKNIEQMYTLLKDYCNQNLLHQEEKEFYALLLTLFETYFKTEHDYYYFEIRWD